jgi:hypothetical protein
LASRWLRVVCGDCRLKRSVWRYFFRALRRKRRARARASRARLAQKYKTKSRQRRERNAKASNKTSRPKQRGERCGGRGGGSGVGGKKVCARSREQAQYQTTGEATVGLGPVGNAHYTGPMGTIPTTAARTTRIDLPHPPPKCFHVGLSLSRLPLVERAVRSSCAAVCLPSIYYNWIFFTGDFFFLLSPFFP